MHFLGISLIIIIYGKIWNLIPYFSIHFFDETDHFNFTFPITGFSSFFEVLLCSIKYLNQLIDSDF
ncbi:hypothetical protein A33Q_1757 [Indibacter alkaliphilus LW1]|uniref:Uncharacterized protein n=1 Tax=Indibacter alkaliphilus (strain CCUG 57479 / KCTC 22604 / LW1) TaxID=1189612 RepID=S2E4Q1_INDAL|nr:hypothetical protein A33Q_1757 [Indibacter alkaliphilus LW1]